MKRNISVGQSIPKATLTVVESKNGNLEKSSVSTDSLFGSGTYVLVGYPGSNLFINVNNL